MPKPTVVREPARAPGADVAPMRVTRDATERRTDAVAVEEPLEIRLNGWRWTVTMRTPGDDADLVLGLLASEGVITAADEVETIAFTRHPDEPDLANVVDVHLDRGIDALRARLTRHQVTSSSCGLCGASTIDAILAERTAVADGPAIATDAITRLPEILSAAQPGFRATGGLHAAALFDATGTLLAAREDIGRHNATDKVLGWRLRHCDVGVQAAILLVSGRASFEIVQKALVAGVPVVAAVSAPSSMAVALAERSRMTLAGFVRDGAFNVYAGGERLAGLADGERRAAAAPRADGPGRATAAPSGDEETLEFIPRAMRDVLDRVQKKISLVDWQALTLEERRRLVARVADGDDAAFARYLDERVTARTGKPPRPLAKSPELRS